jgi:hypothetical protein
MEDPQELKPDRRPAINISIQSWATPIVGLVMLIIGIYGGFFLRPAAATPPVEKVVAQATTTVDPQQAAASSQEIMDFLIGKVRHFKGDPNAPVTMVAFSDFQ